jgi:hypothetical protein
LTTSGGTTPLSEKIFVRLAGLNFAFVSRFFTGKERKRVDKSIASTKEAESKAASVSLESLRAALEEVKQEQVPISPQEREGYFMVQVSQGEQLAGQGTR